MKNLTFFFVRCFIPKESVWNQHKLDNHEFGKNGPTIAFIRTLMLMNGLVLPITIFTNEKVRKVTVLVDMVLAPTISAMATSMVEQTPPLYKSKRVYWLAFSTGVAFGVWDLYGNIKAGGVRAAHMKKPVAIVHNLQWPLFFASILSESIGILGTIADPRTGVSRQSRLLTIIALVAMCGILYWGGKEFYEDGSLS